MESNLNFSHQTKNMNQACTIACSYCFSFNKSMCRNRNKVGEEWKALMKKNYAEKDLRANKKPHLIDKKLP